MSSILFSWHSDSHLITDFEHGLNLAKASGATSLLILACYDNNFTAQQIDPLITTCTLPIFGGIYPKLIFEKQLMQQGCIIIGFQQEIEIKQITKLAKFTSDEQLEEIIEYTLLEQNQITNHDSFLMFYDALITNIEDFIDCLFECLDHQISIIGGGAGNLDFKQQACIFTNQGLLADVIQLVSLQSKLTTGATHGWQILQGPFLVSEANKNTVNSLDYSPAFNAYKEAIESVSNHKFTDHNFFDIAKHFPLGIEDINSQLVVRDPILSYEGYIQCVGNIPVNSMVYLLQGCIGSLVTSAEEAAISATKKNNGNAFSATMIFDCISRVLFLEDSFNQEIDSIAKHCNEQALFGVLSLGEIANSKSGAIRLLNKSTVIGSW
jgi:hypothetical protein